MRKNAWMFLGSVLLLSAAGALLRVLELRTALDTSTMLMDFVPASLILLILSALALGLIALMARTLTDPKVPHSYVRCFGGGGMLAAEVLCLLLAAAGALLCLRDRNAGASSLRIYMGVLALLAALGGAGWLALGLDGFRKKKEDSFLSAVLPVLFCGFFLIVYYKGFAQLPALLYNLYPFLGLCAALGALHLIAGFTVDRVRPRTTLFLCGTGCYLCLVALAGVSGAAFRLLFAAVALALAAHGTALLLPHPPEPEPEPEEKEEEQTEESGEAPEGETSAVETGDVEKGTGEASEKDDASPETGEGDEAPKAEEG